ncbi:MAG: hypothetical protein ACHP7N_02810 [Caulobacterales bacterium]
MVATTAEAAHGQGRRFYVWMGAVFIAIAFLGFIPSFWAKLGAGTFTGRPILYVHGALFFSWTLFVFFQTKRVADRRLADHRAWGVAGVSLATAMAFTIVLAQINAIKVGESLGLGDQARRFAIVSLGELIVFAGFIVAALLNVRRPEIHKRLMILAMIPPAHAAIARPFAAVMAPGVVVPPGVFVSIPPAFVADLLIVAAMIYDWRTRGRPHPVYLVGGAILLGVQIISLPISFTPQWMAIAHWVESLAG